MEAWYKVITPRKKSKKDNLANASIGNPQRRHCKEGNDEATSFTIGRAAR